MKKNILKETIFNLSLYNLFIRNTVENKIEERQKELNSPASLPDVRKITIFQVVKSWAEFVSIEEELPKSAQEFIVSVVNKCDEELNRLLKKQLFSKGDMLSSLIRMGALGKVKDRWKYIVWNPVFNQHRHYIRKSNGSRAKELLQILRSRKFSLDLIEKIVWDDLFTKDIINVSQIASEKEKSLLIDNFLSLKYLGKYIEWAEILAGKILAEIPEEKREQSFIKTVSERLIENKTHSSAKTLLEISGFEKDFYYSNAFDIEEDLSEFIYDEFVEENVNSKFWDTLLGEGKSISSNSISTIIYETIKIAAEPEMVFLPEMVLLDDKKVSMHPSGIINDNEYYFLKYKELPLKKMISELTSSLNNYIDWKKSYNSRKSSIENIVCICNNHRGATQIPITIEEKTKPLIVWIEEFIKSPPKLNGEHKNINRELIERTTSQIEILFRIDRYGKYYDDIFEECK